MIVVDALSKTFTVHRKDPGLWGSIRSLVRRETIRKEAVRKLSFRVDEGEIVGLVGANGAGKTTLVKMLAGIIHPTAGDARVLGYRPWERDNRFRRQIALIMGQKAQLWWDLPASDCFLLLQEIYQIPEADYRSRLDYLTSLLEVREQVDIQIRRLSLGERMKMELIAALLHAPRVVYLDEPTIGLDLTAQRSIRQFILEYRKNHRPAMIVTSHYMEDIETLCQRILILREGEQVFDGPLRRVVEQFAPHKVLSAHLHAAKPATAGTAAAAIPAPAAPSPADLAGIGEVLECTPDRVRIRVPRPAVAASAGALLQRLPVADLAIEEPEIGDIIERIMRRDGATPGAPPAAPSHALPTAAPTETAP